MHNIRISRLGIISALDEEQQGLVEAMEQPATLMHGMRQYTAGQLWGIDAVCVLSRIGKVAAATTVSILVEKFKVSHILFTGVAGSAERRVHVGDIVIADTLLQHDMDASPLFPRFEVPLTGLAHFPSDRMMAQRLQAAAHQFIDIDFANVIDQAECDVFKLTVPKVHRGLIASGDQFVSCRSQLAGLSTDLPGVLAVEMEGAAVAQVCFELGVPFGVMRTISDNANEDAPTDFMRFVKSVASRYAFQIVKGFCQQV